MGCCSARMGPCRGHCCPLINAAMKWICRLLWGCLLGWVSVLCSLCCCYCPRAWWELHQPTRPDWQCDGGGAVISLLLVRCTILDLEINHGTNALARVHMCILATGLQIIQVLLGYRADNGLVGMGSPVSWLAESILHFHASCCGIAQLLVLSMHGLQLAPCNLACS